MGGWSSRGASVAPMVPHVQMEFLGIRLIGVNEESAQKLVLSLAAIAAIVALRVIAVWLDRKSVV